jgi:hypothetical protein
VVRSLRFGVDDSLGHLFFRLDGFQEFKFDLSKLVFALIVSNLVSQSDLHRSVIIIAVVVDVLFVRRLHLAFRISALVHSSFVLHLLLVESSLIDVIRVHID